MIKLFFHKKDCFFKHCFVCFGGFSSKPKIFLSCGDVTITSEGLQRISAFNIKLCCFSTNCIVEIKKMKILLPVYPHSIAFENVIALYYLILLIHTNLRWSHFSVHLPANTSRVAIFKCEVTSLFEKTMQEYVF